VNVTLPGSSPLESIVASPSFADPGAARQALPLIEPAIVKYRWTFVEPVWTVRPRTIDVRIVDPATRVERIDYDTVEITFERKRVGRIPEFSCKYADFALPNECRTTWRTDGTEAGTFKLGLPAGSVPSLSAITADDSRRVEECRTAVVRQQRVHLAAQRGVTPAGLLEVRAPILRLAGERLEIQALDPKPAFSWRHVPSRRAHAPARL